MMDREEVLFRWGSPDYPKDAILRDLLLEIHEKLYDAEICRKKMCAQMAKSRVVGIT